MENKKIKKFKEKKKMVCGAMEKRKKEKDKTKIKQ